MHTPLRFAERQPLVFSLLILALLLAVNAAGVAAAQAMSLPPQSFSLVTEIVVVIVLAIVVSAMRWWREIGFRKAESPKALLWFLPALALTAGSLSFGIYTTEIRALLVFAVLAAASGFVEETIFRGLMLRAFLPRGAWTAVLVPSVIFGLSHAANLLAGADPLVTGVQILYALAIGIGFGAVAVKTRLIWPLVIAHGLGNFFSFINAPTNQALTGSLLTHFLVVTSAYVVLFTAYGLYLMLHKEPVERLTGESA